MNGFPPPLRRAPLLAAAEFLSRPAVISAGKTWSWRQVHAASIAMAAQLGSTRTVCNLCDSGIGFLVAWLAALRSGCLQLLPPSSGRADLAAMLAASAEPCVVVDDAQALQPEWRSRARCLVWRPDAGDGPRDDPGLAWSPDWEAERVQLYTSGSTGTPEAQVKSLGQLARGAQLLGARLDEELDGGVAALRAIVCSVPPQHMFGIEACVMLSLVHGTPIVDRRPLLPADVRAAFDRCEDGTAWITTPLHLRSLERADETLPHCGAVVASTMPLAAALAAAIERRAAAPVLEIYGSTETGAIATRRTAREADWRPLAHVRLEPGSDGSRVWGAHFSSPQTLADHVALDGSGRFALLGRQADLIKIAGRRASLAGLNQIVQELPGLTDAVFYLPAGDAQVERLVLIHAGELPDRAAAEAWLRERIDPVFLPRVFIGVERLPRAGAGKLPRAALDAIYAAWRTKRGTP